MLVSGSEIIIVFILWMICLGFERRSELFKVTEGKWWGWKWSLGSLR